MSAVFIEAVEFLLHTEFSFAGINLCGLSVVSTNINRDFYGLTD